MGAVAAVSVPDPHTAIGASTGEQPSRRVHCHGSNRRLVTLLQRTTPLQFVRCEPRPRGIANCRTALPGARGGLQV